MGNLAIIVKTEYGILYSAWVIFEIENFAEDAKPEF